MAITLRPIAVTAAALLLLAHAAHAQQEQSTPEERLSALERQLQDLEARVEGRGNVAPSPLTDVAVTSRIERLERSVDTLAADIQRVERAVDSAQREANEARRQAMQAERLARDAARPR